MLSKCNNDSQFKIVGYIKDDYPSCLYLYLNTIKYGCNSEATRTWIQSNNETISSVILAYHTALHIYSRNNDFDVNEIRDLVDEIKPTMINAAANTIKRLEPVLSDLGYMSEYGHIGEWVGSLDENDESDVVEATEDDIPVIAKLLFEDDTIGTSYVYEDLLKQIKERLEQGYVHSYVIRRDGKPVAHVGTGAEISNVCTITYTITSQEFRGQGMARRLYNYACGVMKKQGKRVFAVYYPDHAYKFHHQVGFVDVCDFGKLYTVCDR